MCSSDPLLRTMPEHDRPSALRGDRVTMAHDQPHPDDAHKPDLLSRLRRAAPGSIRSGLRSVLGTGAAGRPCDPHVSDATPSRSPDAGSMTARPNQRYRQADQWVGDRYTVRVGPRTHRYFFITGCYKSGTNWAQNILNLHPDVNCKGEFHFEALLKGLQEFTGVPWYLSSRPRLSRVARDSFEDTVRRMIYVQTRDRPDAVWLGDRTPRPMVELLPGAPMINLIRDGRDVLVSWNFHHLRVRSPDRVWPGSRALAERIIPEFWANPHAFERPGRGFLYDEAWFRAHAQLWARIVLHDLDAGPRLSESGTPVLMLRYEQMHADVLGVRRALHGLLGLDESRAAPLSRESRTLPGVDNPSPTKFMRKGTVGDWRNYFDDRLGRWFNEEAGEALARAGYEPGPAWS